MNNRVYVLWVATSEETNGLETLTNELGNSGYLGLQTLQGRGAGEMAMSSMLKDEAYWDGKRFSMDTNGTTLPLWLPCCSVTLWRGTSQR